MAVMSLEDQTGSIQVILFPDVFNSCSRFLKSDEPLLINGLAEVGDNSSKIIANEIDSLESLRQKSIRVIILGIDQETATRESLEGIKDIFFRYPGECSVMFRMDIDNGEEILISANNNYKILPCDEMLGEIEGITGHRVVCRYE